MTWLELLVIFGVPTTITSIFTGLLNWKIQRTIRKQDEKRRREEAEREKKVEEREKWREHLLLMQLQSTEAAVALSKATAKAVQRIPDAKCNGDMTRALDYAREIQNKQRHFLYEVGIQSMCDDESCH